MQTITVNVKEDVECMFREQAYRQFGRKKGVLGRAMTEAMKEWVTKNSHTARCMQLLKGVDMGKLLYKSREELYDRH